MSILLLLLAAVVLAGIVLVVTSRRPGSPFPKCGQCGYNVSASIGTTTRCPECGGGFGVVGITPTVARRNPATLWIGLGLIIVPTTCIGGGLLASLAAHRAEMAAQIRAAQAAQAAAAQQAAAVQAQQPPPPPTPPPPTPRTIAHLLDGDGAIPPPLTQEQINAMTQEELRAALNAIAKAQQYVSADDRELDDRLRLEFNMILQRLREVMRQP